MRLRLRSTSLAHWRRPFERVRTVRGSRSRRLEVVREDVSIVIRVECRDAAPAKASSSLSLSALLFVALATCLLSRARACLRRGCYQVQPYQRLERSLAANATPSTHSSPDTSPARHDLLSILLNIADFRAKSFYAPHLVYFPCLHGAASHPRHPFAIIMAKPVSLTVE